MNLNHPLRYLLGVLYGVKCMMVRFTALFQSSRVV